MPDTSSRRPPGAPLTPVSTGSGQPYRAGAWGALRPAEAAYAWYPQLWNHLWTVNWVRRHSGR